MEFRRISTHSSQFFREAYSTYCRMAQTSPYNIMQEAEQNILRGVERELMGHHMDSSEFNHRMRGRDPHSIVPIIVVVEIEKVQLMSQPEDEGYKSPKKQQKLTNKQKSLLL